MKLKKLDPNDLIKKWGTELNREFSTEEYQMAEKHVKKCSTSLLIRENNAEIPLHTSQNG